VNVQIDATRHDPLPRGIDKTRVTKRAKGTRLLYSNDNTIS
jgi:hypothetical protein